MIFLDNASTTKLCDSAVENLIKFSTEMFYNPSSSYSVGMENYNNIEKTKEILCKKFNVNYENNIIFTGSATEASNLAIFGSYKKSWKKAIFSAGEHPSVYNSALKLAENGVEVIFVNLQSNGEVDYDDLKNKLDDSVNFISIMHVSNETGAINDIKKINNLRKSFAKNALFHVDGVQAFCKIPVNLSEVDVDFYTISAHKFNGPKGIGALYVKNKNKLKPIIFGGGQEYNLRSGTENLASIMALNSALKEIEDVNKNFDYVKKLNLLFKDSLIKNLDAEIEIKFVQNQNLSPYILSVSIPKIKGEVLQNLCDKNGLLISTGSACSSKKSGNRILEQMKYSKEEVIGNIRVSFSRLTTEEEVKKGSLILAESINHLWRIIK